MAARLASASLGVPLLVLAVWYGPPWITLAAALAAALGTWEFCGLAAAAGARPLRLPAVALSVALVAGAYRDGDLLISILGAGLLVSLAWVLARGVREGALADWALTLGGALYPGLPLALAVLMRSLEGGRDWLLFTLLATFAADSGAFFVGRLLGRHPLAPTISPRKTWEGAVGGLAGAVGASLALNAVLLLPFGLWQTLLVGAAIGGVAQAGDLAQSLLKRAAGVKEAGWLIPGHGGILDRLDSVVFTLVLMYHLARWVPAW
jgi:phosphatidate cytidylyltransferase